MSIPAIGTKGVPRPRREAQIVRVATAEFGARGYARASVAAIAARSGISKPLVYQYFGSKDGLYLRCLTEVADALLDRLTDAEQRVDDSVASRIHVLRALFEALEPEPAAWRLLYDPSMPRTGRIAAKARHYRARTEAIAAAGSQRFLAARGITDPEDAAALAALWMGVVDSLVTRWLTGPKQSAAQMTARCERLLAAVWS
ncbi:MAG: TetR/AcrR family transcriptional regulator [Jatrophihabitans sp.]|nr:MAG: TetR/AcrR family transcriptional regulator [Jatrophihabitans sp.]